MKEFLDRLYEIEKSYKRQTENDTINIFNVLFYGHEEVTLHSRFISYLLSMRERNFLELFVREILKIGEDRFELKNCEVRPNDQDKSEYEEIDILIINEKEKQAIIIENKIHAVESIHAEAKCGYKGQLERYYNTITRGEDKNSKRCKYKCDEEKTYVYYLTLYQKPSSITIGELKERGVFDSEIHIIDYYQIQKWLSLCIDTEKSFLNTIIQQYLTLLKNMTTDNEKTLELVNLLATDEDYCQSAYVFSKHLNDVKWHVIHRFFIDLAKKLQSTMPENDDISAVAHNNNKKVMLKVEFDYNGEKLQIVNDDKGFTLGNLTRGTWGYVSEELKKIRFGDFSTLETFQIINSIYRYNIIEEIASQVVKHHQENYENLKEVFR